MRVDGLLRSYMRIPISVLTRVIARIKVLGKLDIADRHRPQDGRAQISVKGRRFDLRISTVPTRGLEKAVVRILDTDAALGLDDVGFTSPELGLFRSLLQHRDGIIVVTGPTGSGKTITLCAALREVSEDTKNIMTVEDPVEYELPEPTQAQVEAKRGVTFPTALRAILRQDPDVILVGEVRDRETAEVAAHASLTGHLVLTTLHSNDATGVVQRFADLGLLSSSIVSTLRGGLAQRFGAPCLSGLRRAGRRALDRGGDPTGRALRDGPDGESRGVPRVLGVRASRPSAGGRGVRHDREDPGDGASG